MTEVDKPIIWLIDENEQELRTYLSILREFMPESVRVEGIFPPYSRKEDYLPILENLNTVCIIVDQRLKDTGVATYVGIELAEYLRSVNTKIPISILTNYAYERDEFIGGEWSVEDIIEKAKLGDDEGARAVIARILRRIDVYEDMLGEREKRFRNLLRKSLSDELGEEEQRELEELQLERTSVILASELAQLSELEQIVEKHKRLMDSLRQAQGSEDEDAL
jgi:hypothetical protein